MQEQDQLSRKMLPNAQRPAPYARACTAAGQRSAAALAPTAAAVSMWAQGRPCRRAGGAHRERAAQHRQAALLPGAVDERRGPALAALAERQAQLPARARAPLRPVLERTLHLAAQISQTAMSASATCVSRSSAAACEKRVLAKSARPGARPSQGQHTLQDTGSTAWGAPDARQATKDAPVTTFCWRAGCLVADVRRAHTPTRPRAAAAGAGARRVRKSFQTNMLSKGLPGAAAPRLACTLRHSGQPYDQKKSRVSSRPASSRL